ncbi:MAG: hypothetical protein U9N61_11975 [Euryarchaeota archaeon]|nr:hypothetical protein [Euryarchaeota archaeon]
MRSVSSTLVNAITTPTSRVVLSAKIEKARIYFSALDYNNAPGFANDAGISETHVLQTMGYISGAGIVTFFNHDDVLVYMVENNSTVITVTDGLDDIELATDSKPALYGETIHYISSDGDIIAAELDTVALIALSDDCLSTSSTLWNTTKSGILHATSQSRVVHLYEDDGGIGLAVWDGTALSTWDARFMFQNQVSFTPSEMANSAAVTVADGTDYKTQIYLSNTEQGSVIGISFFGAFSDTFEAVHADLSIFYISNAIAVNSKIFLAGQFVRTEELETSVVYNLVLHSTSGKTFSIEQATLISSLGYRFKIAHQGTKLYASCSNRQCSGEAPYFYGENPNITLDIPEDDITKSSLEIADKRSTATINIADGDEQYSSHVLVARGNKVELSTGHYTAAGLEVVLFSTYIITKVTKTRKDALRRLTLSLEHTGFWHVGSFTYPFYAEIDSKSSVLDELEALSNMYVAPSTSVPDGSGFTVDMWDCEEWSGIDEELEPLNMHGEVNTGKVTYIVLEGDHTMGVKTCLIKDKLGSEQYPLLSDDEAVVSLYGWSRTDATSNSGDEFTLYLILENEEGEEIVLDTGTTTETRFPLTYYDEDTGDFPIQYTFDVSGYTGYKILNVGIKIASSTWTKIFLSRIAVTGCAIAQGSARGNVPWEVMETDPSTGYKYPGIKVPSFGRPYVMFSQKPADAFNFEAAADFFSFGSNVYYGIVGLARDGANYVIGRYSISDEEFQICKVRDNVFTILASVSYDHVSLRNMMFYHRNGNFGILLRTDGSWSEPVLTYRWTEADGNLVASETGIMHVGIYGFRNPPYIEMVAFDIEIADRIPIAPHTTAEQYALFPASGDVLIDDNVYSYGSKRTYFEPLGPFELRNIYKWPPIRYGPYGGWAIEMTWFDWHGGTSDTTHDKDYENDVFSLDTGLQWLVDKTEWNSHIETGGIKIWLYDRSRWHLTDLGQTSLSGRERAFVGPYLDSVKLKEGERAFHSYKTRCYLHLPGEIICRKFSSSDGKHEASIEDIITVLCNSAGSEVIFPGNVVMENETIDPGDDLVLS